MLLKNYIIRNEINSRQINNRRIFIKLFKTFNNN